MMTILFLLAPPRNVPLHTVGCDMRCDDYLDDKMHKLD